jgi:hypothetical protein
MKQPRFSVTTTYTDDQPPGYFTGTWKAVAKWVGTQQNVADAQIAPVAAVSAQ